MAAVIIFLVGLAAGVVGTIGVIVLAVAEERATPSRFEARPLPPATARQIARAARANRADLRRVRSRFVPADRDNFDGGDTAA